ncbi:MAG: YihY/virulence factor BrkB family protein [Clostridia bacterium]|nr:YihY/virulence factor BrkB family protein [Clostridia bacterium]
MNRFLKFLTKSYKSDRVSVYTGYASFFITISSVPFVALLLFLLGKLSPSLASSFESLLSSVIPNGLSDGLFDIIGKIKETDLSIFLPISIITAIWASCKGTLGLTRGIESVYERDNKEIWILSILRVIFRTLVFALMVILSLVIFSVGRVLLANIHPTTQALDLLLHILVKLRFFAFFLVLTLFFTIAYRCISSKKGILKHIPGALFSSAGWLAFTFLYSKYISYVLEKPSVYASMGTLVLFMLWIYFLVMIVLLGAEINKYFIKKRENEANLQTRVE